MTQSTHTQAARNGVGGVACGSELVLGALGRLDGGSGDSPEAVSAGMGFSVRPVEPADRNPFYASINRAIRAFPEAMTAIRFPMSLCATRRTFAVPSRATPTVARPSAGLYPRPRA